MVVIVIVAVVVVVAAAAARKKAQDQVPPDAVERQMRLGSCDFERQARRDRAWSSLRHLHRTQRAQYPLIKEYGLNYIGLHIMI